MNSKLIVMLTHNDKTVINANEVFDSCKDLSVDFWGFKDVGLPENEMRALVLNMRKAQKKTFLEVVSYTEAECMNGAKLAVDMGFDYLMGTLFYDKVWDFLKDKPIKYMPFVGNVYGSPSILEGSIQDIVNQGKSLAMKGVFGFDILAYRHNENPEQLAKDFVKEMHVPVVIAGSIGNRERIEKMSKINPWGFTMGSALFTRNFVKGGSIRNNLEKVVEIMSQLD